MQQKSNKSKIIVGVLIVAVIAAVAGVLEYERREAKALQARVSASFDRMIEDRRSERRAAAEKLEQEKLESREREVQILKDKFDLHVTKINEIHRAHPTIRRTAIDAAEKATARAIEQVRSRGH